MIKRSFIFLLLILPAISLAQIKTVIQQGHAEAVTAVKFAQNGKYILTGSRDKSIKLWERSSGNEIASFREHSATIKDITLTEDENYVVSISADGYMYVWDINTRKVNYGVKITNERLTSVEVDKNNLIYTGGYDRFVWIIDPAGEGKIDSIPSNPDKGLGTGVQLNLDRKENLLYLGEDNRVLRLYDLQTNEIKDTLKSDYGWCGGCGTFSDYNKDYIIRMSNNDTLYVYDRNSKDIVYKPGVNERDIVGTYLTDKSTALIATEKSLKLLEIESGETLNQIEFENELVINDIDFSGEEILTGHNDNIVRIWNSKTLQLKDSLSGILNRRDREGIEIDPNSYWDYNLAQYIKRKNSILLHSDGESLLKGKPGVFAKSWNLRTGSIEMEYRGHQYAVTALSLSKDGKSLITGDAEGFVNIWEASSGILLHSIRSHRGPVFDIDISENMFVTTSWDGRVVIRDISTLQIISQKVLESNSVYSARFTPDGYYIALGTLGKTLELWEINTMEKVRTFLGHNGVVASIDFNQDGNLMLTAGWDGFVRVWDISTGLIKYKPEDHDGGAYTAVFDLDGNTIISGGADRKVKFWSLNDKILVNEYEGHQDIVTDVIQVPGSDIIISHSLDGVTRTWHEPTEILFHEHISTGPGDWMIRTEEGYFKATDGIMDQIHFVKEMKSYDLDQFFDEFYRPDIIQNIDFTVPEGSKNTINNRINSSPPPETYIRAIKNEDVNSTTIFLRTINTGGGVNSPELYQNGKKVIDITADLRSRSKKDTSDYTVDVPLVLGENKFSFYAYSKDKIASKEATVTLFSDYESRDPEVYLLAIGINKYSNTNLDLNYAKDDALSFSDSIYSGSRHLFKQVNVRTILDTEATKETILEALDELTEQVQAEDVFIFYYAGHGTMIDDNFYFVPTESKRLYDDKMDETAIPAELVQQKLKDIRALKQMIVMDACQSGASVDVLAKRGLEEERALAQLARSTGIHVLASAGSEQYASEFQELGHGLFTYVLLESLSGKADGAPKDGKITVYEIKSYLDDQVPRYNLKYKGTPQYPYTFSKGNDFPLVIIDDNN